MTNTSNTKTQTKTKKLSTKKLSTKNKPLSTKIKKHTSKRSISRKYLSNNLPNNLHKSQSSWKDTLKYTTLPIDYNEEQISFVYSSGLFLSESKTARHVKREPFFKDKIIKFLDDYKHILINNKPIHGNIIKNILYHHNKQKCICENILQNQLSSKCQCRNIQTYIEQGKSGAIINTILCADNTNINSNITENLEITPQISNQKSISDSNNLSDSKSEIADISSPDILYSEKILKVNDIDDNYIKFRNETRKYIFLEMDKFTIQTIISSYLNRELPNNTIKLLNSGICKNKYHDILGYNLMEKASLGAGRNFINGIINGKFNKEFNIKNADQQYLFVINFLLQCIFIVGHLQYSSLEFFHGDCKPDNFFVKKSDTLQLPYFHFNIDNRKIKLKNMGFAVLIADFDHSSISLNNDSQQKYRIISPILYKPILGNYVNEIISKYADIDPNDYHGEIIINKLFISNIIPVKFDPTISILRSAGVKLYRDFDLYTFFIKLIDSPKIFNYILTKKIDQTIMSFMSDRFKNELFKLPSRTKSLNESAFIAIDIFNKIREPLYKVFSPEYFKILNLLNYRLFK